MSAEIMKSPKVLEYMQFKGRMTVPAFVDILKTIPAIKVDPHEGQLKIIEAYEERVAPGAESVELGLDFEYKYRCLVAACGRRFGKSVIAAVLGAQELLVPNARVLICSYTLDNCEVIFKQIRSILIGLGVELSVDRQKDMELEIKENGATLRVASNDNVQSKLGTAVSLLILDEAKLFPRTLYEQILLPMLFDYSPYSRSLLISSPQAGWFETYYKFGQDVNKPKYWSINLPTHSNPTIPRQELLDMEKNMPTDLYEQEVLGLFTSAAGLVCREFDNVENVFHPEEPIIDENGTPWSLYELLHEGNIIFHSIDSGYSHYFGSLHFVDVPQLDHILIFHEYQKNKTLTSTHADNIKDFETDEDIEVSLRYADPAAAQQIADFVEYGLYFNKSEKLLRETITCVNTALFQRSSVTGRPKLLVSSDCAELIRQMSTVQWKEGLHDFQTKETASAGTKPFKPDTDKKTDWDLFDTLRYGLFNYLKNNKAGIMVIEVAGEEDEIDDPYERAMREHGFIRTKLS